MTHSKGDNQAARPWRKDLAEALKKASGVQRPTAESSVTLKAALESLSAANRDSVAEALRKISARQEPAKSNAAFLAAIGEAGKKNYDIPKPQNVSAAWAKVAAEYSGSSSKDLVSALQRIAAAQKGSKPVPTINRLMGMKEPDLPKNPTEAHGKAFRAGLIRGMQEVASLNLNPWPEKAEVLQDSAVDALREDWMLIERDLWTTVEKMRRQLEELPPQTRVRLAKMLAQYLRSQSVS